MKRIVTDAVIAGAVLSVINAADIAARKRNNPQSSKGKIRNEQPYKTRENAAVEYLDQLGDGLSQLSYSMDDYDFDKIHLRLFAIYQSYSKLDTLSGLVKQRSNDSALSIVTDRQAREMRTQAFIDSFITVMEKERNKDRGGRNSVQRIDTGAAFIPVIKQDTDSAAGSLPKVGKQLLNPLMSSQRDSDETIVLQVKQETAPQNKVQFEITKLKEKTTRIHRFFDAGEFSMSRSELDWLVEYFAKVKLEIINYVISLDEPGSPENEIPGDK